MADASDSKSDGGDLVWVQVPTSAVKTLENILFSRAFCHMENVTKKEKEDK